MELRPLNSHDHTTTTQRNKPRQSMTNDSANFSCSSFIVGAPKCGTTSLANWVNDHPQVAVARIKEPHYFNTDMTNRTITSQPAYQDLFAHATEQQQTLEASTWYLYSPVAIPAILSQNPSARIVVAIRNPIDMCLSLYRHNRRFFHEDAETFDEAWKLEESRRLGGEPMPKLCECADYLRYRQACSLGTLLERATLCVPSLQLHTVLFDDLVTDPGQCYRELLSFLKVKDDGRREFPIQNQASIPKSKRIGKLLSVAARLKRKLGVTKRFGTFRLNERKEKLKLVLSNETIVSLRKHFLPEIETLERLLKRDLSHWSKTLDKLNHDRLNNS